MEPVVRAEVEVPYKVATLCELRDAEGRFLLLHRRKHPNRDMYSPIGGKLELATGESPTASALREIEEEAGLRFAPGDIRLLGIISEQRYQPEPEAPATHWLMYWYRVLPTIRPEAVPEVFDEGRLEWYARDEIESLPLPETDRSAIWPAVFEHTRSAAEASPRDDELGFFCLHIDCSGDAPEWRTEQSVKPWERC